MVERLGWTLVHFVWEGALVALALASTLWLAKRDTARVRYALACFAMSVLALAPVVTFWLLTPDATNGLPIVSKADGKSWTNGEALLYSESTASDLLPWLVRVWMVGVILLSMRLAGTLLHLERWRRRHTQPADEAWQAKVDTLAKSLGIRRAVRLLVSERINVPSAWGVLKTVVVLPTSLIMQLPPEQVETILLHELAHVHRHDYLVNLLQAVVETVLFYHPAVWWVSAVVRREREHCCDDVVVAHSDPMPYARALLHLEERRLTLPRPTLSAKESNLMNRIARILTPKPAPPRVSPLASSLAALGVLGAILGGTLEAQAQAKPTAKPKPKIVRRLPVHIKNEPTRLSPTKGKPLYRVSFVGNSARIVPVGGGKPIYMVAASSVVAPVAAKAATSGIKASQAPKAVTIATGVKAPSAGAVTVAAGQGTTASAPAPAMTGTTIAHGLSRGGATAPGAIGGFVSTASSGFQAKPGGFGGGGFGGSVSTTAAGQGVLSGGMVAASPVRSGGIDGTGLFGHGGQTESDFTVDFNRADNTVSVDLKDTPLSAALRALARKAKLSVVIEKGDYGDVTMVLNDIPFEAALRILCRAAGATYRNEDNKVYFILPKE